MKYGRLFTEAEKEDIANRRIAGESCKSIAKDYHVSPEKISGMVPGINNSYNPDYSPYVELRHKADDAIAQREWYKKYKPAFERQDNVDEIKNNVLRASKEFNRKWEM